MLTNKQNEYLSDFARLKTDDAFAAEWARKWGRTHELRDWPADPEFRAAYAAIEEKHKPPSAAMP